MTPRLTRPGLYRVSIFGRVGAPEVVSYSHPERRYWVDCPTHGPTNPEARVRTVPGWGDDRYIEVVMTGDRPASYCATCGALGHVRRVQQRRPRNGQHTECGSACLSGRVSCDCRCRGRCHGAGECSCGAQSRSVDALVAS